LTHATLLSGLDEEVLAADREPLDGPVGEPVVPLALLEGEVADLGDDRFLVGAAVRVEAGVGRLHLRIGPASRRDEQEEEDRRDPRAAHRSSFFLR
jgi:hypothetical protein